MRLLIVEDDEMSCLCVQKWIREMNLRQIHHVDVVFSAEEALQYARTWNVDILLTDIQMVNMNGLELIEAVQQLNSQIRCLILTAYASFQYAHQAIRLGVCGFLLKPFSRSELQEALLGVIRGMTHSEPSAEQLDAVSDPILWSKNYVQRNLDKEINMALVANELNLSYTYFSKVFKQQTGLTFSAYVTEVRMKEAGRLLLEGCRTTEVAEKLGYGSPQNFNRAFCRYWKCTPAEYRKNSGARYRSGSKNNKSGQ